MFWHQGRSALCFGTAAVGLCLALLQWVCVPSCAIEPAFAMYCHAHPSWHQRSPVTLSPHKLTVLSRIHAPCMHAWVARSLARRLACIHVRLHKYGAIHVHTHGCTRTLAGPAHTRIAVMKEGLLFVCRDHERSQVSTARALHRRCAPP